MFLIDDSNKLRKILTKYLDDLKTDGIIIIDDVSDFYSCIEFFGSISFFYEIRFYGNQNKTDLLIRLKNGGYINEYIINGTNDMPTLLSYQSIIDGLGRTLTNPQKLKIARFIYLYNTSFTKIRQIIDKINTLQSDLAQILG